MRRPFAALTLASLCIAAPATLAASPPPALPVVTLVYPAPYGAIFDRTCQARFGIEVEDRWIQETLRRRAEFQERWDREGPRYLDVVIREVGAPFPYAQMQATLTVCTEETLAMPLMINTRSFLSDATVPEDIVMWPRLVFHELMHHYTEPVNQHSALQKKYAAEGLHVTLHLHVVAMEKLALTRLGRKRELELLDLDYRQVAHPAYRRAWEIVALEGLEPFVAELREHLPKTALPVRATLAP